MSNSNNKTNFKNGGTNIKLMKKKVKLSLMQLVQTRALVKFCCVEKLGQSHSIGYCPIWSMVSLWKMPWTFLLKGQSKEFKERPEENLAVVKNYLSVQRTSHKQGNQLCVACQKAGFLFNSSDANKDNDNNSNDNKSPTKFLKKLNKQNKATAGSMQICYMSNLPYIHLNIVIVEHLFCNCCHLLSYNCK